MSQILTILGIGIFVYVLYRIVKPTELKNIDKGGQTLFDGLEFSTSDFYDLVEAAIAAREIPQVSIGRIILSEGSLTMAKREYLRIARKGHIYDICGASFGTGFFVSWRLGNLKERKNKRMSYFQIDTENMYKQAIKMALDDAMKQMQSESRGMRALAGVENTAQSLSA